MKPVSVCTLCLLLLVLSTAEAWAARRPRTDVIVLRNGDRITGEVKGLSRGQLMFKTDDVGTVTIKWEKIAQVSSGWRFEVQTFRGLRYVGALESPSPGQLVVRGDLVSSTLEFWEVVAIRVVDDNWWRNLTGSFDLGFSYTRSSGVGQLSTGFHLTSRRPAYESDIDLSAIVTETPEQGESSQASIGFTHTRLLGQHWIALLLAEGQRNRDLGINFRGQGGGLMGYRFLNTNLQMFGVGAGALVNREVPVEGASTSNVEALIATMYSLFILNYPKTNVDIDARLLPSLSDTGRLRFELNASARRELWRDFSVGVSLYDYYDSRPPAGSSLSNDVGLSLTVGWTF